MKKSIRDFDLKNKKVIIRCDFNVPIKNNKIEDNNRIVSALKTINYASDSGAKVILLSHLGKIKNENDKIKNDMKIVYEELKKLIDKNIYFENETCNSKINNMIEKMNYGDILLLQNTRYEDLNGNKESGCDLNLSKYWASLADIFINDAFGTIHRKHASNYGISKFIDSGIGFLIEDELKNILTAINKPQRPFVVVLGGSKVEDKIKVIDNLVLKADYIIIGGGMCNTFLKAKGYELGKSLIDNNSIQYCKNLLNKYENKILLPIDLVVSQKFENIKGITKIIENIKNDDISMDIGEKTIEYFKKYLNSASQIIWNGPMGVFEFDNYMNGTKKIAEIISNNKGITIAGGGDSVSAIKKLNLQDKFSHISTGGGATLKVLEGSVLPGIENIKEL